MNDIWSIDAPRTIDVDNVSSLKASIVKGRLDVIVHEEPTVRVEVSEVAGDPLEMTLRNGVLEISHTRTGEGPLGFLARHVNLALAGAKEEAVISIAVPRDVPVKAATVSGDGLVCGAAAGTDLSTVSGSMMADDTAGKLTVNTVSGEVIVRHHTGDLVAKSVSGEITASGYLNHIRASTVSGDLSFDLHGTPQDLGVNSVSGDVTVRVPEECGVDIAASSATGSITVNDQKFFGFSEKVKTRIGPEGRGLTVRSTTVSGTLAVFHRDTAGSQVG
jgi:DUF4097 and DUF4098 domain-containing protein YvlB